MLISRVLHSCAKAFIIGEGDAGSSSFAMNTDLGCEAVAPSEQETCPNAFRNEYAMCSSSFSPREEPTCSVTVEDGDGNKLGVLSYVGS